MLNGKVVSMCGIVENRGKSLSRPTLGERTHDMNSLPHPCVALLLHVLQIGKRDMWP